MVKYLLLGSLTFIMTVVLGCETNDKYCCENNELCTSTSEWPNYSCSSETCGQCEKVYPLAIDPLTLPDATIGQGDYRVELTASGGIPPCVFTLARGDEEKLKWLTITPDGDNKAILHNSIGISNEPLVPTDLNDGIPLSITITLVDSSKHGTADREDNQGKAFQMTIKTNDCPHYCQKITDTENNPTAKKDEKKCENNTSYTCTSYYPLANCVKWDNPEYCPQCHSDNSSCCVNECLQAEVDTKCTADGTNNAYYVTCTNDTQTGCLVWGSEQTQCKGKICDSSLKVCGECENDSDYCLQGSQPKCVSDPRKKQVCGYNQTKGCYLWSIVDCKIDQNCVEGACKDMVGTTGSGGGIIFYVYADGLQYLEVADKDQGQTQWGCSGTDIIGSHNTGIGYGKSNTEAIVLNCQDPNGVAAALCYKKDIKGNGYTDWFLPSYGELKELYDKKSIVGGSFSGGYWSSSSCGTNYLGWSFIYDFNGGGWDMGNQSAYYYVRCVRSGP